MNTGVGNDSIDSDLVVHFLDGLGPDFIHFKINSFLTLSFLRIIEGILNWFHFEVVFFADENWSPKREQVV